ncbi:MAG TPA: hypothetical protein VES60_08970 [Nakamurella sp.]|nr:hypothetical protein [Nakamurella sp.]
MLRQPDRDAELRRDRRGWPAEKQHALDFLRTLGKPDNTLIMVISDNGATIAAALRQAGG